METIKKVHADRSILNSCQKDPTTRDTRPYENFSKWKDFRCCLEDGKRYVLEGKL